LIDKRQRYLARVVVRRDQQLIEQLRDLYDGSCQICNWAPRSQYNADVCEGHHIRWLSRGGDDVLGNLVLLCPNHHRTIHRVDAPFDFSFQGFVFPKKNERISLIKHMLIA